uniref:mannitol dehydrogenase family protein n=1 Tax=Stappia sp. TaxID=1870903 RepID=UPI003BABD295
MPADYPRLTRSNDAHPGVGIVHLGLGAFFRAHGAIYIAEAMAASGGDWGITGVSLKRPDQRDRLAPQGCAYTALELGPDGEHPRVIEVIENVLVAPEDPAAVVAAMAAPGVRIVSLTVTEKGYCHEPATGRLMRDHPDIKADLANPESPSSAPGFIVRALAARRAAGLPPFTVMSCDNLPDNGHLLRGVVLDLAALVDPNLAAWIEKEGSFPATMVDRIVPATKDEDLDRVAELTGRRDESPVLHEPFRQWVIEDDFVDGMRPDLGAVGVELVEDVAPYEAMKLRCLNGTHSTLAYLGYLAGHETIAETVADEAFARFVTRVWDEEIIPGLTPPPGVSLTDYSRALLARYANPGIRHRTWQIAMDGSQKLPQRILTQLAEGLAAGRAMSGLTLAVAAWMRYVGGTDEKGAAIDVRDPMAERLKALSDAAPDPRGKAMALLGVAEVFPAELRDNADFRERLATAYAGLAEKGARAMVESCHA